MANETTTEKVARLKAQLGTPRRVNPFSWMVEDICGVTMMDLPDDPLRKLRPPTVRIGLVSMPEFPFELTEFAALPDSAEAPPGVDPQAYLRALVAFKGSAPMRMYDAFREALDAALSKKPHVICFNELGLPSDNMIPMREAQELAWQKSQDHEVLIIAGSAHDRRTLLNTGYLFRPGGPVRGQTFHKTVYLFTA